MLRKLLAFFGIHPAVGGCGDPFCDDCATEWDRPVAYDGFGAPIYPHQEAPDGSQ